MLYLFVSAVAFCLFNSTYASTLDAVLRQRTTTLSARQIEAINPLSPSQIEAFKPFTFFASAAYCNPNTTINWSCGANCDANPGFLPTASGGDGTDIMFWYVGFDPSLNAVIVAHQGTNTSSLISILTDFNIRKVRLNMNSTLFPGVSSSVEVHKGFLTEQARTASTILTAVNKTLNAHPGSGVALVGHSLGAAISLLDTVFLQLHLPSSTPLRMIGYGLPRVGNQAFADYVDQNITSLSSGAGLVHINNKKDPIPILPGMFLGYHHPSGEIHIQDSGAWDTCPGQDNPSNLCIVGDVPNLLYSDPSDHDGPYDGVEMNDCSA